MMRPETQLQLAEQIRALARKHCDGELTKAEYRRRRRQLLESISQAEDPEDTVDMEVTLQQFERPWSLWPLRGVTAYLMATTSLVVLGVIVALLIRSF